MITAGKGAAVKMFSTASHQLRMEQGRTNKGNSRTSYFQTPDCACRSRDYLARD